MKLVKEFIPYVIIIAVVILIRTFIVTPVQVDGHSMDPTLKDHQILILNKWKKDYNRFDIVVIDDGEERLIKRIIGLPGETLEIKNNKLYINGKYIKENFEHDKTDDFIYHNYSDDNVIKEKVVKEYLSEISRVGADEVIVLCPTRVKGELSSAELNKAIQKAINPVNEGDVVFRHNGLIYKVGDRVIQLKNTPNLSNGDLGIITDIKVVSDDEGDQLAEVSIQFEDQELVYYKNDMKNVSLAYALTIHKSQGDEYKSVLIAIGKDTPKIMLKRNLLYTRITRAKEKCSLFGPPEVYSTCIKTSDISSRKTLLADRICEISKTLKISA